MKRKNAQIIFMSIALSAAVVLFWQYTEYDWSGYAGLALVIGGITALFAAYRFLLAFLGKAEINKEKDGFPVLHPLSKPEVSGIISFMFELPVEGMVHFELQDMAQNRVKIVCEGMYSAGSHIVALDTSALTQGVYYCQFKANKYLTTRKIIVNSGV
jgi:hypothetical protein